MKRIFISFLLYLCTITIFAQNSGRGFSYQAVARDAQGDVLTSKNISVRFSLMPGQQAVTPAWQETQVATTDAFGTFGLVIGKGIKTSGTASTFADINFASAPFWLRVEIKDTIDYKEVSYTALSSVPYAEVANNVQACPVGMIMPFAGDTSKIPSGWMLCDGRTLDRTQFSALYNVIGTAWGCGNNSSTFNIPELRGLFLRGVDYTAGYDPDKNSRAAIKTGGNTNNGVGSYQANATKTNGISLTGNYSFTTPSVNHTHDYLPKGTRSYSQTDGLTYGGPGTIPNSPYTTYGPSATTNFSIGLNSGDNETRPCNAYVNFIIKY